METNRAATETIRADDFIEYFLFPSLDHLHGNDLEAKLANFLADVNECVRKYIGNYIWHKEPLQLITRTPDTMKLFADYDETDELPPHLHGLTFYGENIQDEWFIVQTIFHLTKEFPDLIARVIDADGEFMLIEAAEALPKWANPETCLQRVYISDGHILLVQNSPSGTSTELSVSSALRKIRQNGKLYRTSNTIVDCITQRFIDLAAGTHLHRAYAYLPTAAAQLLKTKPQLISYAVRAFYNHDTIDIKSCRAMKHFPPETRVYVPVTFTRCLYAMLSCRNYTPDRRVGWNLPQKTHETYKSHALGVKIASGFEILASKSKEEDYDIETNKSWHQFLSRLKENGYFGDNIEHSKGFCERLEKAKDYFKIFSENHYTHADTIVQELHKLLRNIEPDGRSDADADHTFDATLDDDDAWLNISADDLDAMMAQRYGIRKTIRAGEDGADGDSAGVDEACDLTENLEKFLNQKSEFDGIDFRPTDADNKAKPSASFKTSDSRPAVGSVSATSNGIDFDADAFQNHLRGMLDFVIPEDNWDSQSDSMSDFNEENVDDHIEAMINGETKCTDKDVPNDIAAYMDQMDRELAATTIGMSFRGKPGTSSDATGAGADGEFDDIESFTPVNIDVNALKNLAESYQAQLGAHGPAATLLSSMGLRLDVQNNGGNNDNRPNEST